MAALEGQIRTIMDSGDDPSKIRSDIFGKSGLIQKYLDDARSAPLEVKGSLFKEINEIKLSFLRIYESRFNQTNKSELDVTLPTEAEIGLLHVIPKVIDRMRELMTSIGLLEESGPYIDDEEHNFDALNVVKNHPARGMHDTFYLRGGRLLRTHTSNVQIRALKSGKYKPPFGIFHIGRVYRRDDDSSHSPVFHQMEAMVLDKDITFANLKFFIKKVIHLFFEDENLEVRFRPSYFPFTEPSLEVDIPWHQNTEDIDGKSEPKWVEVLGAGMIRRNILERYGYQDAVGFACGMGIERLAMLKYGIDNINHLYKNRFPFLRNYTHLREAV